MNKKLAFNINNIEEIPKGFSKETINSLKSVQSTIERIKAIHGDTLKRLSNSHSINDQLNLLDSVISEADRHNQLIDILNESLKIQEVMLNLQKSSGRAMLFATNLSIATAAALLLISVSQLPLFFIRISQFLAF